MAFALGNIQNLLDGVGGPDHVTIALVVHGAARKAFHAFGALPDISATIGPFAKFGLQLAACGNTMKAQHVTLADLLPAFVEAEKGAWCGSPSRGLGDMSTSGPDLAAVTALVATKPARIAPARNLPAAPWDSPWINPI